MKIKDKLLSAFKSLKSKKGFSTIEIAIASLIFVTAICGFIDLTVVLKKLSTISTVTNTITRTVGRQGGLRTSAPSNFAGEYTSSSQLYNDVATSFEMSGIPSGTWTVTVGGSPLTKATNLSTYDYGKEIPVVVTVNYKWQLVSNFIPGSISQTKTSSRSIVSSYKIRDGNMSTEYKK